MVNAYAVAFIMHRISLPFIGSVLGQRVDDKSNEITAIPALLRQLNMAGAVVMLDAMGYQTAIAQQIVDKKADYLLSLKGNQ